MPAYQLGSNRDGSALAQDRPDEYDGAFGATPNAATARSPTSRIAGLVSEKARTASATGGRLDVLERQPPIVAMMVGDGSARCLMVSSASAANAACVHLMDT